MFYITLFPPGGMATHPDFTSASISMIVSNIAQYQIIAESGVTIQAPSSMTITSASYTNQTVTYVSGASYTSDVYFQTNNQSYTVIETYNQIETPDLTCSSSGSSTITYSIGDYAGVTAPTWVSVNSVTGVLSISAPSVAADTVVSFYINSNISGVSSLIQKIIQVTVLDWAIANWLNCSSTSSTTWDTWISGYNLNNNQCIAQNTTPIPTPSPVPTPVPIPTPAQSTTSSNSSSISSSNDPSSTAKGVSITSQSVIGSTAVVVVALSVMNASSISSFWSMVNQVQLLFLLLLTRAFIPVDVEKVITGMKIALNLFQYLPFNKITIFDSLIENLDFNLSNQRYGSWNIESDSTGYNIYPLIWTTLIVFMFHIFIWILLKLMPSANSQSWFSSILRIWKRFQHRILLFLTFGYYIRVILEVNQFMLISSIYEIHNFDTSPTIKLVSFGIAVAVLLWWIVLIGVVSFLTFSSYEVVEESHNKLEEFFKGVKMQKKYKTYSLILIIRRTIFVVMLISLVSISSVMLILILSGVQLLYLIYLTVLRPFKELKNNMIEIINEIYFILLLGSLAFLNTENKWTELYTNIYIWVLGSNNMVSFSIVSSKLIQ